MGICSLKHKPVTSIHVENMCLQRCSLSSHNLFSCFDSSQFDSGSLMLGVSVAIFGIPRTADLGQCWHTGLMAVHLANFCDTACVGFSIEPHNPSGLQSTAASGDAAIVASIASAGRHGHYGDMAMPGRDRSRLTDSILWHWGAALCLRIGESGGYTPPRAEISDQHVPTFFSEEAEKDVDHKCFDIFKKCVFKSALFSQLLLTGEVGC